MELDGSLSERWFGVRCILRDEDARAYEERITIWRAGDLTEAISMAEFEITQYVEPLSGVSYTGLAQAYAFDGPPMHGSEIFSLIRDSDLEVEQYLSKFFDSGGEHQGEE